MTQLIRCGKTSVQTRTVTKEVKGKRVRVEEPIPNTHSLALIDGNLQVVRLKGR